MKLTVFSIFVLFLSLPSYAQDAHYRPDYGLGESTSSQSGTPSNPTKSDTYPCPNDGVSLEAGASYSVIIGGRTNDQSVGTNSTAITVRVPFSCRWSVGYEQMMLPPLKSDVYLAGGEFRESFARLFKKQRTTHNYRLFDLNGIQPFVRFGVGTRRTSQNADPGFAAAFGGGIDLSVNRIVALRIDAGYLYAQVKGGHNIFEPIIRRPTIGPSLIIRF